MSKAAKTALFFFIGWVASILVIKYVMPAGEEDMYTLGETEEFATMTFFTMFSNLSIGGTIVSVIYLLIKKVKSLRIGKTDQ